MDRQQLECLFATMAGRKIMVVGDLMLDEYVWGRARRISPEAPVQIVEVERDELRLGGAGNVVNNLLAIGCQVSVASVIGADEDGRRLKEMLRESGVDVSCVTCSSQRVTSRKSRVLASHQQILRIDREIKAPITELEQERVLDYVKRQLREVDVVILSDYLKGVLTPGLLRQLIDCCRDIGIPVVVDPKGPDFGRYCGATLLTPNRREAELASGLAINDEDSLLRAGATLLKEHQLSALVVTRSEEGMSLFLADGVVEHLSTEVREVFDVSGAGDTVVAVIAAAIASGVELSTAARLANLAAGIVVGKLGTSKVSVAEIVMEITRRNSSRSDGKILSRTELADILTLVRRAGEKIVFTNGCFDLLHAGHVKYLQKARQLGDVLVLGLNSDASIRRLKGEKRPLLDESERAQILAALDCIDYVTVFEEGTPFELIRLVQPDVLAKGGDYFDKVVVGSELVEGYGGEVILIEFEDGKSTSNIIDEVLTRYRSADA